MGGVAAGRGLVRVVGASLAFALVASPAFSFEAFDGRLQVHGFFESQLRLLNEDFREQWDVAQWYQVLNVELELDILQDTIGPVDLMSAFIRVEGRFDCALYHGCGVFRSVNTYGDNSKKLPRRLSNAEEWTYAGDLFIANEGRWSGDNTDPVGFDKVTGLAALTETEGQSALQPINPDPLAPPRDFTECTPGAPTPTGTFCYTGIKPFDYVFEKDLGFRFTQIANGQGGGNKGHPIQILGPWLPKNFVEVTNARFDNRVNPFDGQGITPVLLNDTLGPGQPTGSTGVSGAGARRFRPIPIYPARDPNSGFDAVDNPLDPIYFDLAESNPAFWRAPLRNREDLGDASWQAVASKNSDARGVFVPSEPLRDLMDSGRLNSWDFDFTNQQRAFNRGASQQDEGELKEAYLDIEMFDSRLWLLLGKQNIVWGKTELFRTTDQFNPTDLALASLPSLEEARIGLWAFRGVYSFYEVGPLEDVRLELAMNFDQFEPVDLGTCGEAFAVNLVCSLTLGGYAHGFSGFGIAGNDRPPNPWDSGDGVEFGGRLEFRWDRYSFAISDFYGYEDFPYLERITNYERNVDPFTGRGRVIGGRGKCRGDVRARFGDRFEGAMWAGGTPSAEFFADPLTGTQNRNGVMDPDCLRPGPTDRELLGGVQSALFAVTRANDIYVANDEDPRFPVSTFGSATYNPLDANYDPKMDSSCAPSSPDRSHCFNSVRGDPNASPFYTQFFENPDGTPKFRYYENNALDRSPANLTLFSWLCSNTIGFIDTDRRSCAQTIFSSEKQVSGFAIGRIIGLLLAGDPGMNTILTIPTPGRDAFIPLGLPNVRLSIEGTVPRDPVHNQETMIDYRTLNCRVSAGQFATTCGDTFDLSNHLTSYQEALLGCGPFWGTNCDEQGIDLLNTDASALYQSFAGHSGTNDAMADFRTRVASSVYADDIDVGEYRADGYARQIFLARQQFAADNGIDYADTPDLQGALVPGTLRWQTQFPGGHPPPVCSTGDLGDVSGQSKQRDPYLGVHQLPGCRRKWNDVRRRPGIDENPLWDIYEDGDPDDLGVQGNPGELFFPEVARGGSGFAPPGSPPTPTSNFPSGWTDSTVGVFVSEVGPLNCNGTQAFCGDPPVLDAGLHPFTNEPFASEISGVSWNFHMLTVAFSDNFTDPLELIGNLADPGLNSSGVPCNINEPCNEPQRRRAVYNYAYSGNDLSALEVPPTVDGMPNPILPLIPGQDGSKTTIEYGNEFEQFVDNLDAWCGVDPTRDPICPIVESLDREEIAFEKDHCSYVTAQQCSLVQNLYGIAGNKRNVLAAGGNGRYGRRTFWWHSGGEVVLRYDRRNVLGFSVDFAEDRTKSNWGIEFTWIGDVPNSNNNSPSGITRTNDFNLTVSIDRPTFINFLNPNRTFFFNTQWFFQYKSGYRNGFTSNGPFNVLATFSVFTGYFQDRLNPSMTVVGDFRSGSGAFLPSISYRFSENFSATVGINMFWGREQLRDMPLNEIGPASNRTGANAYRDGVNNVLALIRDRDELFARIRYTF